MTPFVALAFTLHLYNVHYITTRPYTRIKVTHTPETGKTDASSIVYLAKTKLAGEIWYKDSRRNLYLQTHCYERNETNFCAGLRKADTKTIGFLAVVLYKIGEGAERGSPRYEVPAFIQTTDPVVLDGITVSYWKYVKEDNMDIRRIQSWEGI